MPAHKRQQRAGKTGQHGAGSNNSHVQEIIMEKTATYSRNKWLGGNDNASKRASMRCTSSTATRRASA
eukprot:365898-Chlamydomonas_euryale.AAC.17